VLMGLPASRLALGRTVAATDVVATAGYVRRDSNVRMTDIVRAFLSATTICLPGTYPVATMGVEGLAGTARQALGALMASASASQTVRTRSAVKMAAVPCAEPVRRTTHAYQGSVSASPSAQERNAEVTDAGTPAGNVLTAPHVQMGYANASRSAQERSAEVTGVAETAESASATIPASTGSVSAFRSVQERSVEATDAAALVNARKVNPVQTGNASAYRTASSQPAVTMDVAEVAENAVMGKSAYRTISLDGAQTASPTARKRRCPSWIRIAATFVLPLTISARSNGA
jgi:hypothetical protein